MSAERGNWWGEEWEKWGRNNPYFGVITEPRFRGVIGEAARQDFFRRGEEEVGRTLADVRRFVGRDFRPRRTLDFGCGVGRLTIPLARESGTVVAVDVSSAMLEEARANCARVGVGNVEFQLSQPGLSGIEGPFDFVHSFIVFQHIPPPLGHSLFETILDRMAADSVGMMHFTYARRGPLLKRMAHAARRSSRLVHRVLNLAQRRPFSAPLMAMFEYDLGRLVASLQQRGFQRISGELTDHSGCLGVMLTFVRGEVR